MPLDTVRLGQTGLRVSELPFGTWRFGRETAAGRLEVDREAATTLLDTYAENGGRTIDTANVYGGGDSEEWIGDWLTGRDREDYVIASKVYFPTDEVEPNHAGLNRKHVRHQVEAICDRLGTDYVDLLYIHRWDEQTPTRELLRTLTGLVDDGRIHYLGASTFRPNAWRVARANELARQEGFEPFTVTQPRYNLVNREIEGPYLEWCREQGLAVLPWSPLAQGFLTGKYDRDSAVPSEARAADSEGWADRYLTEPNFEALDVLRAVADDVDASPAQTALAWLCHHPGVTAPIVGARTVDQLEENLGAADVDLDADQVDRLSAAKPGPFDDLT
jgi:aryl-alcohol dehydrogenase-like predicted oxidoreductase